MKFYGIILSDIAKLVFREGIYAIVYFVTLFVVSLGEVVYKFFAFPLSLLSKIYFELYAILTSKKLARSLVRWGKNLLHMMLRIPHILFQLIRFGYRMIETFVFWILYLSLSGIRFIRSIYFRYFVYGFLFCLFVLFVQKSYILVSELPTPRSIGEVNFAQSTHVYDRKGRLLYEIFREFNRTKVDLKQVPPTIINATIAIEDKNFYNHKGISFFGGILRAIKDTVATNELQGGSTITQQLVKTALLTPERTIERKMKEIILALWTEQVYTKEEIMEMYLNQVPYGGSAYGIEEAANVYFDKNVKNLSLSESALLAGLTRAPSVYSPFINPELAKNRRDQVLTQMNNLGFISKRDMETAKNEPIQVQTPKTNIRAPHFVMYTRSYLEEEYGSQQVEEAGLRVTTTLDLTIQEEAERILKEEVSKMAGRNVSNGGIIVMKPDTGEILAMVGSVDYFEDEYGAFNVTTALRQPGSTLKPMLYSMALTKGYTAATRIDDSPIIFQIPGSKAYIPYNYDKRYHGRVTIRQALANSYNIPAVKVLNTLGVSSFVDFARDMGISSWNDPDRYGLSLALGGAEVTLLDLTQVFGVFASGGYRVEQNPVLSITDSKQRDLLGSVVTKAKVLDSGVSYIISDILADNEARLPAFGRNNSLAIAGHRVSVKTGTTNDYRDAWTVGYTPQVVVGVWVGNNNNSSMFNAPGSLVAAPIFKRLMTYLLEEYDFDGVPVKPDHVIGKPCYAGKTEYFIKGTENTIGCYEAVIKKNPTDTPENTTGTQ